MSYTVTLKREYLDTKEFVYEARISCDRHDSIIGVNVFWDIFSELTGMPLERIKFGHKRIMRDGSLKLINISSVTFAFEDKAEAAMFKLRWAA